MRSYTVSELNHGVIFDLDGVIVSTDECHYLGWKRLADEEGIPFDRQTNSRLRGVSRMESLEIVLERRRRNYSAEERDLLAHRKNCYYRELLQSLSPTDILPGVCELITSLRAHGVRIAIGSSSRNCPLILEKIGLADAFDAVVDGNSIRNSKPDPEVFLKAAELLGLESSDCLVVEDAEAGVRAGLAAGMPVLAVGAAVSSPLATLRARDLSTVTFERIIEALSGSTQYPVRR